MLTTTRLHVIIRPRGGDFLYSPIEVRTMLKDIEMARQLGADGVVFGCLTANGEIDLPVMQELMKASQGLSVTFHRAFDVCRDPESIKSDMKYKNESVSMGGTVHIDEYERNVTTAQRVINTIQAIKS